ncbi:MAG: hypothetical protein M1812_002728 [Candelaria pacifica]|nr:MAG: hypothetical protein M1812_002728 [Candelaria pacifica]
MTRKNRPRSGSPVPVLNDTSNDSSSSSSPEPTVYDDTDFFLSQPNDSQSSVGLPLFGDMTLYRPRGMDERVSPVSRLPPELLIAIFAKVGSTPDLKSCMLVSKKWARNSVDLLWHRPLCNNWANLLSVIQTVRKTDGFFAYFDLVKRLNLSNAELADKISDGTVQSLMGCKRVERLTLTNCSKLTDLGVMALVEGNRSLLALDISGLNSITDQTLEVVANNCVRLQGLNISGCVYVTDKPLIEISENCRHIKRLKLNYCSELTDDSIVALANNCPYMLEIDLHDCRNITSKAANALITKGRYLRELRLAHCSLVTDEAFLTLPNGRTYESLRILDLTNCDQLADEGVEKIISAAPRLRNLVLAKCRRITDRAILAITKLGKNLHYVHLGHCQQITDDAVIQLIKLCNRIRYIDMACCHRLTDSSVQQLATLPKLRRIGLVKCQAITDKSIEALASAKHSSHRHPWGGVSMGLSCLERVHLSYCQHLTLAGIHQLLNRCPRLTHLSLTGVQAFLRADLTVFCRKAPPEFTDHQRDVFCVFSNDGVERLRSYLNEVEALAYEEEGTMYDEADEDNEDENQLAAGLNATALTEAEEGNEVEETEGTESPEAEEELGEGSETEQG